jgi:hypothetical protein
MFWQPFWKWQISWKFWKCRIAPLMVVDPKVFRFVVKGVKAIFLGVQRGWGLLQNPMGNLKFRTLILITSNWIMIERHTALWSCTHYQINTIKKTIIWSWCQRSRTHEGHYGTRHTALWSCTHIPNIIDLYIVKADPLQSFFFLLCLPFEWRETYCFSLIFSSASSASPSASSQWSLSGP